MELGSYEAAKFELAEALRALLARAPKDCEEVSQAVPRLFGRLAEDRFNLLVVGRFSRGKTSLMNAILGMDRLPTGLLPLTSVITLVAYGEEERVRIQLEDGGLDFEIPLPQLAQYITEEGNPGNVRRVRVAQIELPVEILRRGFHFVDSPGLGSAIAANSRTTRAFLPEADAVMLVSGFEGPLSEEEQEVVRSLSGSHRRLFLVLNKQDTVSAAQRAAVHDYVQHRLAQVWAGEMPKIFSISARDGLGAKLAGNAAQLAASGLTELERELERFLIEEKGRAFLAAMCERAAALVDACPLPAAERTALRARIAAIAGGGPAAVAAAGHGSAAAPAARQIPGAAPAMAGERLRMSDCALCSRARDALFEFMRNYQYELAVDAEAGERFAQRGGLCGPHLQLYASMAADRDVCVAMTPLLKRLVAALQEGSPGALLQTHPSCAVCTLLEEVENSALKQWCAAQTASSHPLWLCLPHLRKLAQRGGSHAATVLLSQRQAQAAERLVEDMQRYVLKRDGIRRGLTTPEEVQAANRAISFVAGSRVPNIERCKG